MLSLILLTAAVAASPATDATRAAVLTRPLAAGAIVTADDLASDSAAARSGELTPTMAIGLEARRALSPGMPLRGIDLITPRLVRRGDSVILIVRGTGFTIRATGRALADGAADATVPVVASATSQTLTGHVTAPDVVTIAAD